MLGWIVRGYRLVMVVLILAAVIYNATRPTANLANMFSYFTILSNVIAAVVLGWGIVGTVPDLLRGAAVLYMSMTGIIYELLLAGLDVGLVSPWANNVLHRIGPVVMVVDWLLAPPVRRIGRRWAWWLPFPLVYLAYTLIRGPVVHWYPYPFLDPTRGGYGAMTLRVLGVTVAFIVVAILIAWIGGAMSDWRHRRAAASGTTAA